MLSYDYQVPVRAAILKHRQLSSLSLSTKDTQCFQLKFTFQNAYEVYQKITNLHETTFKISLYQQNQELLSSEWIFSKIAEEDDIKILYYCQDSIEAQLYVCISVEMVNFSGKSIIFKKKIAAVQVKNNERAYLRSDDIETDIIIHYSLQKTEDQGQRSRFLPAYRIYNELDFQQLPVMPMIFCKIKQLFLQISKVSDLDASYVLSELHTKKGKFQVQRSLQLYIVNPYQVLKSIEIPLVLANSCIQDLFIYQSKIAPNFDDVYYDKSCAFYLELKYQERSLGHTTFVFGKQQETKMIEPEPLEATFLQSVDGLIKISFKSDFDDLLDQMQIINTSVKTQQEQEDQQLRVITQEIRQLIFEQSKKQDRRQVQEQALSECETASYSERNQDLPITEQNQHSYYQQEQDQDYKQDLRLNEIQLRRDQIKKSTPQQINYLENEVGDMFTVSEMTFTFVSATPLKKIHNFNKNMFMTLNMFDYPEVKSDMVELVQLGEKYQKFQSGNQLTFHFDFSNKSLEYRKAFFEYFDNNSMIIDYWDADTFFHQGQTKIILNQVLRQGKQEKIIENDFGVFQQNKLISAVKISVHHLGRTKPKSEKQKVISNKVSVSQRAYFVKNEEDQPKGSTLQLDRMNKRIQDYFLKEETMDVFASQTKYLFITVFNDNVNEQTFNISINDPDSKLLKNPEFALVLDPQELAFAMEQTTTDRVLTIEKDSFCLESQTSGQIAFRYKGSRDINSFYDGPNLNYAMERVVEVFFISEESKIQRNVRVRPHNAQIDEVYNYYFRSESEISFTLHYFEDVKPYFFSQYPHLEIVKQFGKEILIKMKGLKESRILEFSIFMFEDPYQHTMIRNWRIKITFLSTLSCEIYAGQLFTQSFTIPKNTFPCVCKLYASHRECYFPKPFDDQILIKEDNYTLAQVNFKYLTEGVKECMITIMDINLHQVVHSILLQVNVKLPPLKLISKFKCRQGQSTYIDILVHNYLDYNQVYKLQSQNSKILKVVDPSLKIPKHAKEKVYLEVCPQNKVLQKDVHLFMIDQSQTEYQSILIKIEYFK